MTMMHDESFGVIPLKKSHNKWFVYLIQHQAGHWSFPKGHAESGETPQEAATRELFEETGLSIQKWLFKEPLSEEYTFQSRHQLIRKKVQYFLAQVEGEIILQELEIKAGKWVPLEEADQHMTFPAAIAVCHQAQHLLKN